MRKKITLFFIAIHCMLGIRAQHSPIICGNEIFSDIVREKYPQLNKAIASTFEDARTSQRLQRNEPLTIRVVVHVVWKEEAENLHDSIILDQLRIINEDFNHLNADADQLRHIFRAEAGSADIHFELAQIVRVQTDQEFNVDLLGTNLLAEVKHNIDGGSDAWDPDAYLNLWVCKIQPVTLFGVTIAQILGFAFPPNNLPHWPADVGAPTPGEDGVVIDFRTFGSNNSNPIENPDGSGDLFIKGRTPVHEIGHYLGLRHIWGDGGLLGPNDCAQSDGVDDTPFADAQSAFDCDTTRNSCTQIETHYNSDVPDLIENFMDYSNEGCMNMFTHGQVELMRNVLTGPRSGLLLPFSALENHEMTSMFSLWPNPAQQTVNIDFSLPENSRVAARIIKTNGQVISNRPGEFYPSGIHQIRMDVYNFPPGMYMVELRTDYGTRVEKLMIN